MKLLLVAAAVLAAIAVMDLPAQAQNYPWCEYLGAGMGGGRNCGFVSYEQCMASAWGNGGDCRQNTLYVPPPGPHHLEGRGPVPAAPPHHRHVQRKSQKSS